MAPNSRLLPAPAKAPRDVLDPVETEILRRYFGLEGQMAEDLLVEDDDPPAEDDDFLGESEAARDVRIGVRLSQEDRFTDYPGAVLANGVARICLNVIGSRRLTRVAVLPDGRLVEYPRTQSRPRRDTPTESRHLFTIDWTDRAPGMSWPESYCATYVPDLERFVVTVGGDTDDVLFEQLAIGWFHAKEGFRPGCCRAIEAWWRFRSNLGSDPWEFLLHEGDIDLATAEKLRWDVWLREREEGAARKQREAAEREERLTPFRERIDAAMSAWVANKPRPAGQNDAMGWGMRKVVIRKFIEDHVLERGDMPRGAIDIPKPPNGPLVGLIDFDALQR